MAQVLSTGTLSGGPPKAGPATGDNSGPTGSSRSYPKGSKVDMSADFNPQKCAPSTYGVKGA